ncbi:MAG TPA: AI-2E family transporter [Micromonosporaceae bacterium]|nr:AI-2E family transporter [Micromonosporaceae bacterium]
MGRFGQAVTGARRAYLNARETVRQARGPSVDARDDLDDLDAEPVAEVVVAAPSVASRDDEEVPHGLRVASAWAWRLLVLAAAMAVTIYLVGRLKQVLVPLAIALLLAALLTPAVGFLRRRVGLAPSLATGLVVIGGLAAVAGTLTLVITQFINGFPKLSENAAAGVEQIQGWLQTGPLHLSSEELGNGFGAIQTWISENTSSLTSSALSTAVATLEVLASLFLVLFATFFLLRDGRRIWRFLVRILPRGARAPMAAAGEAAWHTLVAYVRATVLVAFIDAVGIGLFLLIFRVDFAFPLAALVFLGAFIPIVGATISGTVAILVALVTRGPLIALAILIAVIAVQQLEGHVLQPLIMGRAVAIHPLAVIVAIAAGVVLAGIIGALVAVPIVAVLNTGIRHLLGHRHDFDPDAVVVSAR